MLFLYASATVILLLILLAADHALRRFHHTRASRRLLAAEGMLALAAGIAIAWYGFAGLAPGWRLAVGVLLALPVAALLGFVTVEAWRKLKLQRFDREIARLRRRVDGALDELDRVRWQLDRVRREQQRQEADEQPREEQQRLLQRRVEVWQGQGGMARLRTIKVRDWQQELRASGNDELAGRAQRLEQELRSVSDPEREETLRVQLALVELERHERRHRRPASAGARADAEAPRYEDLRARKSRFEDELRRLQEDLRRWEQRRAAFLRDRIPLD